MSENPFDEFIPAPKQEEQAANPFDEFIPAPGAKETKAPEASGSFVQTAMDGITGLNRGVESAVEGVTQLALKGASMAGLDTERAQARLKGLREARQEDYNESSERSPIATGAGNLAGSAIAGTVMGGPVGAARGATAKIAAGAASGATFGATATYGEADERIKSGLIGGALGAAIPAAVSGVKKIFKHGTKAGEKVLKEAAKRGLTRPTVSQVTGREGIGGLEKGMARIPGVGTRGAMRSQAKAAAKSVDAFIDKVSTPAQGSIEKVGAKSTGSLASQLSGSINKEYVKNKELANAAYKSFTKKASKIKAPVDLNHTRKQIKSILSEDSVLPKEYAPRLKAAMEGLQAKKAIKASDLPRLNKALNEVIEDIPLDDRSSRRLAVKLKDAFGRDVDAFAKNGGDDLVASFKNANNVYATKVGAMHSDPVVSKLLKGKIDSDQILGLAVKNERPELIKTVMKNLSPEGRGKMRAAIFDRARDASKTASGKLDAVVFIKKLHKLGDTMDSALSNVQKKELAGLTKFVQSVSREVKIGMSASGISEGSLGAVGIFAGWAMNPFALGGALATASGVSQILTRPGTSKLLLSIAKSNPGSTTAKAATKTLIKLINDSRTKD